MRIYKPVIITSLITIVIGTFCIYTSWEAYSEYRRISEYGGYVTGYVTKKHFSRASDGKSTYYLDCWFSSASAEKVNATGIISKQQWESLKEGDLLEVGYGLSHPDYNLPTYGRSARFLYLFSFPSRGYISRLWNHANNTHVSPESQLMILMAHIEDGYARISNAKKNQRIINFIFLRWCQS